jgi:cytochrome c oxidase subunit 3
VAERTEVLNLPYAATFTVILVASSVTCQLGVFAAERGDVYGLRRWFTITLVMARSSCSVSSTSTASSSPTRTRPISSSPYGSVFYLTTGFHGLHVIGGLFAFVIVLMRSTIGRFSPEKATSAIVTSYYWHFVDVVWIGLFAAIYIIK